MGAGFETASHAVTKYSLKGCTDCKQANSNSVQAVSTILSFMYYYVYVHRLKCTPSAVYSGKCNIPSTYS